MAACPAGYSSTYSNSFKNFQEFFQDYVLCQTTLFDLFDTKKSGLFSAISTLKR